MRPATGPATRLSEAEPAREVLERLKKNEPKPGFQPKPGEPGQGIDHDPTFPARHKAWEEAVARETVRAEQEAGGTGESQQGLLYDKVRKQLREAKRRAVRAKHDEASEGASLSAPGPFEQDERWLAHGKKRKKTEVPKLRKTKKRAR